ILLLPTLILLSGLHTAASAVDSIPKYEYKDPLTGKPLLCNRCPPGTHMVAHCTASTQTKCAPCANEYFTELWNYLPRCLYCHSFCTGNQEVARECSPTSDRVCRCKQGFYSADDFCIPHTECGPGEGVLTRGSSKMDTVCEKCSEGFYSTSTSALDSCIKQEECEAGQLTLLQGSVYQDTVCGSCEDLANGGETLRRFLSGFLSKMRKTFVFFNKSSIIVTEYDVRNNSPLLDQIRDWVYKTPEKQLWNMPQMLRSCQLSSMADRLQKRLSDIKQLSPNCTLSF
uniref:TNFR-Cys domain-containing protein n=1 Tax=Salarias fasciatus TaxID=181472 RepID=A0A672G983_SALFA